MKKNDLTSLKSKSEAELVAEVMRLRKDWLKNSSDLTLRKSKNLHEKNKTRRNIARVLTLLQEKKNLVEEIK